MSVPTCDVKGQTVRLWDVFALGPFMVWFGLRAKEMPTAARVILVGSGIATVAFNGVNYLRLREPGARAVVQ